MPESSKSWGCWWWFWQTILQQKRNFGKFLAHGSTIVSLWDIQPWTILHGSWWCLVKIEGPVIIMRLVDSKHLRTATDWYLSKLFLSFPYIYVAFFVSLRQNLRFFKNFCWCCYQNVAERCRTPALEDVGGYLITFFLNTPLFSSTRVVEKKCSSNFKVSELHVFSVSKCLQTCHSQVYHKRGKRLVLM